MNTPLTLREQNFTNNVFWLVSEYKLILLVYLETSKYKENSYLAMNK